LESLPYNFAIRYWKRKVVFFVVGVSLPFFVFSQEKIFKILVEGNKVISTSNVISKIKVKKGDVYNEAVLDRDIKNLYATGYFESVEVEKRDTPQGIVVVFKVKEKPILKKVVLRGIKRVRRKEIENLINLKERGFLDEYKVKKASDKIKEFYRQKGFSQVEVSYRIDLNKEKNEAQLTFTIEEKSVMRIKKVIIKGNKSFPRKKIIKLMKTKEAGFFRRGIFKEEVLEDDIERIKDFYKREGFSDVKVDYVVEYLKKRIYITINIQEGRRYFIGEVKVKGNEKLSSELINKQIKIKKGEIFVEDKINEQALKIQELYFNRGYIFAKVEPRSFFNPQTEKVDVTFNITENEIAYVEKIKIRGNVKTKDKVIRRELRIYPGDKFEGEKVRKSRQRLENLGFFEEIRFDTEPGSRPNWENLIVEVKEAKTGYLSFGGGYSSISEFMGFIEIRQRNFDYRNWPTFTGGGQDLSVYGSWGTITERYEVSFTNPWIFEKPISFGFDGYKKEHSREEDVGYGYEEKIKGGALRLGKEITDYLKVGVSYRFETVEITDVVETATRELKDEEGKNDLSSVYFNLSFDRRDNVFNPSKGTYFSNRIGVTGGVLGGDKDFVKYWGEVAFYFPILSKSVIEYKVRAGVVTSFSDSDKVPIYERFFAGGSSTIRGYHERKIGPIDPVTEDPIGGESLLVTNVEYKYPLTDFLKGVVFFDSGNVWEKKADFLEGGMKSSLGVGLRVKTPIGPISLDYGWPLNLEPGEEKRKGRFHFNISRGF